MPTPTQTTAPATYTGSDGKTYNSATGQLESTSAAPGTVQSESDIYAQNLAQGQTIIDQINAAAQAQIQSANTQIDQAAATNQQNMNALSAVTGGFGSTAVAGAGQVATDAQSKKTTQDQAILANAQSQVATYMSNLQSAAQTQANYETANYPAYQKSLQDNAQPLLQGLAKLGKTDISQLANSTNPSIQSTYQNLLQAYGGDPNAVAAALAMATPVNQVTSSWAQGNTYYQLVTNPQTGAVSVQSFNLPVAIPQGATVTKTGTNSSQVNFPDGSIGYITTDPISGALTFQGTGSQTSAAQVWAAQGNASSSSNSNTNTTGSTTSSSTGTSTNSSTGSTNYPSTFSTTTGITDLSGPMNSDTIASNGGVGNIVAGIISAEGGSLPGVTNNPGNIKYTVAPGQTDSGVKATDGGTFASYSTPEAGKQAIADLVTSAASGTNSNYGASPTFQSFLSKYANLPSSKNGTNGTSSTEYGALSNVDGFNPGTTGTKQTSSQIIDQGAFNYLQSYLSGNAPSTSGGMGGIPAKVYQSEVQARAEQLYTAATGKALPNASELKNNLDLINGNNAMLVSLGINIPTITANAKLLEGKITAANINQNAPAINSVIDPIINALGNPAVASYVAQNSTLANELGSLLALKNAGGAGGSTVHDKLAAAGLIDKNSSAAQIATTVNTILQEAGNAQSAIGNANFQLYTQTDPLGIDPQNPLNSDMTFTDENGNPFTADKGSLTSDEVQTLISNGYNIQYSTQ